MDAHLVREENEDLRSRFSSSSCMRADISSDSDSNRTASFSAIRACGDIIVAWRPPVSLLRSVRKAKLHADGLLAVCKVGDRSEPNCSQYYKHFHFFKTTMFYRFTPLRGEGHFLPKLHPKVAFYKWGNQKSTSYTVDWNYFVLENICENGRKLVWENLCDWIFLRKFITTIITI